MSEPSAISKPTTICVGVLLGYFSGVILTCMAMPQAAAANWLIIACNTLLFVVGSFIGRHQNVVKERAAWSRTNKDQGFDGMLTDWPYDP